MSNEEKDNITIYDASMKLWQKIILICLAVIAAAGIGYIGYNHYAKLQAEKVARKAYLKRIDTLGATEWEGFNGFEKLGMSKANVYKLKASAAKYSDAQEMPEMSLCTVENIKKTDNGYSYVLTMYWSNMGSFEIYNTTCNKKAGNILYDFAGDKSTIANKGGG